MTKTETWGHSSQQLGGGQKEMGRIHGDAPLSKEGHIRANEASLGCREQGIAQEESAAVLLQA